MCWFADWVTLLSAQCKYKMLSLSCLHRWHVNNLNHTCTYNCLPEDEHVELMVRITILVFKKCILLVYITRSILMLSYHLRLFHLIWSLPFPFPHAAIFISLLHITPHPLTLLDLTTRTIFGWEWHIKKLIVILFSPVSCCRYRVIPGGKTA